MLIPSISCYFIACHNYFILYRYLLDGWSLSFQRINGAFTLFLPSSLLSEIRQEVEYSGGTVAEKIRFYIESGRHWRKKYGEKLTELVLADARDELIEHDSVFLDREQARLKRNRQKSSK